MFAKLFRGGRLHQEFDTVAEMINFWVEYAMSGDEYLLLEPSSHLCWNFPLDVTINAQAPTTSFVVDNPNAVVTLKGTFQEIIYLTGSPQNIVCSDFLGQQTGPLPFFKGDVAGIVFQGVVTFVVDPGRSVLQAPAGQLQVAPGTTLTLTGGGTLVPA